MTEIKNWIEKNLLQVNWINPLTFTLDGKTYLYLKDRKELVNYDFQLILQNQEIDILKQIDYDFFVFKFGERFYYSPVSDDEVHLNDFRYIGESKEPYSDPFLGIHGSYELCSGSRHYSDWVKKAKFLGMDCLGLCDRNTLGGTLIFQKECKKEGIKSILGETVSVRNAFNEIFDIKLYAKNKKGWNNLLHINKKINVDNYQLKLIEEKDLFERAGELVCVIPPKTILTKKLVSDYKKHFKSLYYQFDPVAYVSMDEDRKHLIRLKKYMYEYMSDLPPVIISDAYYLEKEDSRIKNKLTSIGKTDSDFLSNDQFFKPTSLVMEQIIPLFEENGGMLEDLILQSTENLQYIKDECNYSIQTGTFHLPKYEMTAAESEKFQTNEDLFFDLISEGIAKKIKGDNLDEILERIETETEVIKRGGFIDYFLILWDIIKWCKRENILVGPGRGSSAGSMVAYLMDITKVDPIKYTLLFERGS